MAVDPRWLNNAEIQTFKGAKLMIVSLPGCGGIGAIHFLMLLEQFLRGGNERSCNFIKMSISSSNLSNLFTGVPLSGRWKLNSRGVIR